jgi:hypothetical protein
MPGEQDTSALSKKQSIRDTRLKAMGVTLLQKIWPIALSKYEQRINISGHPCSPQKRGGHSADDFPGACLSSSQAMKSRSAAS